jgi:hypothetical protein
MVAGHTVPAVVDASALAALVRRRFKHDFALQ